MLMETLSCGFHRSTPSSLAVDPSGLSPPATPTGSYSSDCSAGSSPLYSETRYAQTGFAGHGIRPSCSYSQSSDYDDANNNVFESCIREEDVENGNLDDCFSRLQLTEEDEEATSGGDHSRKSSSGSRRTSRTKKTSKSSRNKNDRSRKDSFVYDVRLPDEQFLFFVPDLDLVKSHLMFAVREEVEVLKEKIVELCDRIHNLECENNLLKQYTPQDTLQQVQQQLQQQQIQQPAQQSAPPHHSSTS